MGAAAGTAVGGAVSGNVLHAATTTAGAAGGIAGLVVGSLLSSEPKGKMFYGAVDVKISDPASGVQHTVVGTRVQGKDPNDPQVRQAMQQLAAEDLANKIAELMP